MLLKEKIKRFFGLSKRPVYETDGSDIVMGFWDDLPDNFVVMAPSNHYE